MAMADGAGGINFYHDGNSICWRRGETRKAQQEEGSYHGWVDQEERGWSEEGLGWIMMRREKNVGKRPLRGTVKLKSYKTCNSVTCCGRSSFYA